LLTDIIISKLLCLRPHSQYRMGRGVCLSVFPVPKYNSRKERPRKPKFGRMEAHHTSISWTYSEINRRINAHTVNAQYLLNGKGRPTNFKLGTQTEHEDPHKWQAPRPPRSKVKVARSRDASDRYWPISREWNVLEKPKLMERLSTSRVIMRTSFKVKGQRSRSSGRLMLRQEVRHIFRTESLRTSNLVHRRSTKTRIGYNRSDLQDQRSRSQGHVMRLTGVDMGINA